MVFEKVFQAHTDPRPGGTSTAVVGDTEASSAQGTRVLAPRGPLVQTSLVKDVLARGGHHVSPFVDGAHTNRAVLRLGRGWWGLLLMVPTEIRSGLGLAQARQLGPAHDGLAKAGRHHDVGLSRWDTKSLFNPIWTPSLSGKFGGNTLP